MPYDNRRFTDGELLNAMQQRAGSTCDIPGGSLSLSIDDVYAILDEMIASPEGATPLWYRTPEQQLAYAKELWGNIGYPEPPQAFTRQKDTELLLLHVPFSFDQLVQTLVMRDRPRVSRSDDALLSGLSNRMKLKPCAAPQVERPTWLAFNPVAHRGLAPSMLSILGVSNIATTEVLSAMIQFPEWSRHWTMKDLPTPFLGGYNVKYEGAWQCTPVAMQREAGSVELTIEYSDRGNKALCTPTVRVV